MESVRILRIAAGGDGVGRLADGRTVFVPRTAPGDLIEPADLRLHARFARASVGRLVEPGPGRVVPRCAHYRNDACGGCQLQHLDQASQQAARRAIAGDALRRIAKLSLDDPELDAGSSEWNYRSRITLAVDTQRQVAGFHQVGDPDGVFPLVRCEIADERLNEAWQLVASASAEWPPALSHIVLRVGRDGLVHVVFRGPVRPEPSWGDRAGFVSWWEAPETAPRRVTRANGGADPIPPGVFEQVQRDLGARIRAFALDQLGPVKDDLVWDLYAGVGETSALLAERGARVESVELDPEAVAAAECAAMERVTRHAGTVESWIDRMSPPAAVITNPPRTGMAETVVRGLLTRRPGRIVYISCDPATLARDLSRFGAAYRVTALRSFDLFPQTAHVETVVRLDRA